MRRFFSLLTALLTVTAIGVLSTGSASALGGESLGCAVFPNTSQNYQSGGCTNPVASSSYGIDFRVLGGSGTYSYAWSVPSKGQVSSGCTSTSSDCWVTVPARTYPIYVTESVVLSQGGSSVALSATADIEPYCNGIPC